MTLVPSPQGLSLKANGFYWSTWSGITVAFADVVSPPSKPEILARYEDPGTQGDPLGPT